MTKKIRNAVRTFLIKENQVICTKYKIGNVGYIDIPGGKIELDETQKQAVVWEFKEETGIDISELEKKANENLDANVEVSKFDGSDPKSFKVQFKNWEIRTGDYSKSAKLF